MIVRMDEALSYAQLALLSEIVSDAEKCPACKYEGEKLEQLLRGLDKAMEESLQLTQAMGRVICSKEPGYYKVTYYPKDGPESSFCCMRDEDLKGIPYMVK